MSVPDDRAPATSDPMPAFLAGFQRDALTVRVGERDLTREFYRRAEPGPSVVLVHEMPTVARRTIKLANFIADRGFTVVVPVLVGTPTEEPTKATMRSALVTLCTASEFEALATGRTGAIADWLRALVDLEFDAHRSPLVGVIGMCFSGGFALATAVNPRVGAAVISQPGLPFPVWFDRLQDPGLSDADIGVIKDRVKDGACLRAMRYSADFKSPVARFERLVCEFPGMEHVQIQVRDPRLHSVLGDAIDANRASTDRTDVALHAALDGTLTFLRRHLRWDPPTTVTDGTT